MQFSQSESRQFPVRADDDVTEARIGVQATIPLRRFCRVDDLIEQRQDVHLFLVLDIQTRVEFRQGAQLMRQARGSVDRDKNLSQRRFLYCRIRRRKGDLRLRLQARKRRAELMRLRRADDSFWAFASITLSMAFPRKP